LVFREDGQQPVFARRRPVSAEEVAGRAGTHAGSGLRDERTIRIEQEVTIVRNAVVRGNIADRRGRAVGSTKARAARRDPACTGISEDRTSLLDRHQAEAADRCAADIGDENAVRESVAAMLAWCQAGV